jgi:hypothetical protein
MIMGILWFLIFFTIFMCAYVLWLRPWLIKQWWAAWFYKMIEPLEIFLWSKSETVLYARFKQFMGILTGWLTWIGGFDITPFVSFFPEEYQPFLWIIPAVALSMGLFLDGMIIKKLREGSTKPLEVVAMPEDAPVAAKEAVAEAEAANKNAVAVANIVAADAKAA